MESLSFLPETFLASPCSFAESFQGFLYPYAGDHRWYFPVLYRKCRP
ncbi:hypothetical protein SynA1560_02224 [Synechococcus sp. A15-60]|nr:hypothetical protein SynA1560_02224 [Synechococcus sp. A15-60]